MVRKALSAATQWFIELDKLLSLRGLAALAVVVYHVQNYLRPNLHRNVELFNIDLTWLFTPEGKMPVIIFFTLSGYLMFKAFVTHRYKLNRQGVVGFYKSRARRILPLYYFLSVLFLVFVTPKLFMSPKGWATIRDVFIFNYDGFGDFIAPFWSLSVEVQFYILTPLIAYLCLRFLKKGYQKMLGIGAIVALAVVARLVLIHPGVQLSATEQLVSVIDAFLIGGFSVFVVERFKNAQWVKKCKRGLLATSLLLGVSIIPFAALYFFKFPELGFNQIGVSVIALLTCVFIFASEVTTEKKFKKQSYTFAQLIRKPWILPEFIGALSYGIYLWHAPVIGQMLVIPINDPGSLKESLVRSAIVILISSILAYLTYKYIELYQSPKKEK